MKTTFEIQKSKSGLDKKAIIEKLFTLKNVWNIIIDSENSSITFEYLNRNGLEMVRRELNEMGLFVINDTHHLDPNTSL